MKPLERLALLGALLLPATLAHAQQCQQAQHFLGRTMPEASAEMNRMFPGRWAPNGPLCSANYVNLMTEASSSATQPVCGTPQFPVERFMLFSVGNPGHVFGAAYMLPGQIDTGTIPAQMAGFLNTSLVEAQRSSDALLDRALGRAPAGSRDYRSADGRYFVTVARREDTGNVQAQVYDLKAIDMERSALASCVTELGR